MEIKGSKLNTRGRIYNFNCLNSKKKKALSEGILKLNQNIFENYSPEFHNCLFFNPKISQSFLSICHDRDKNLVGYFNIQLYKNLTPNKKYLLFRAQTGLLPEFRRKTASIFFIVFLFFWYRIRYPFHKIDCLLIILNPGVYAKLAAIFHKIIPHPNALVKISQLRHLSEQCKKFDIDFNPDQPSYAVKSPVRAIISDKDEAYLERSQNPYIQFYSKMNPDRKIFYGLLTLIPFSWRNTILSSYRVIAYLIYRATKQYFPQLFTFGYRARYYSERFPI